MFRTDERQSLCEVLVPPDGYRLDKAVVTTYSLDLTALVAIVSSAGGGISESGDDEWSVQELARAVLGLGRNVTVYAQQGLVRLGSAKRAHRLLSLFERFIVPISPRDAAFHPKVWAVKFVATGPGSKPARYRLLCSSRNLTAANTWECGVVLEGAPAASPGRVGPAVARFLRAVGRAAPDGRAARAMATELAKVKFGSSRSEGRWKFDAQTEGAASLWRQVGFTSAKRALFVAPFLGSTFLDQLRRKYGQELRVISTQSALDGLVEKAPDSDLAKWLTGAAGRAYIVVPGPPSGEPRLDLHAKLLLEEAGRGGRTVVGSANGTSAAWGLGARRNWEASVTLEGPNLLQKFEREFVYEAGSKVRLRPWIQEYHADRLSPVQRFEEELEQIQRSLGAMRLRLHWDAKAKALVLSAEGRLPEVPKASVDLSMAPFGVADPTADLADARPLWRGVSLVYKNATLSQLGALVMVRAELRESAVGPRDFFLLATIDGPKGWQDLRDQEVLRESLGDSGLYELLMGLLRGQPPSASEANGEGRDKSERSIPGRVADPGVLESILHAWATAPDRFDGFIAAIDGLPGDTASGAVGQLQKLIATLKTASASKRGRRRV